MMSLHGTKTNTQKEVRECQNTSSNASDVAKKRKWIDCTDVPTTVQCAKQSDGRDKMDTTELYRILKESTVSLRKGSVIMDKDDEHIHVTEIWAMPHVDDPTFASYPKEDVGPFVVAIFPVKAEENKAKLIEVMKGYPDQSRLRQGPSYIEIGAEIGSQEAAFNLAILGKHLGLCDVMSPLSLGFDSPTAIDMILNGFYFIRWRNGDVVEP